MEIRLEGTASGSYEIKMDFDAVVKVLENMKQNVTPLKLPVVYEGINGQNELQFINKWIERESSVRSLLIQYISIVEQNIADTKANAEMLKNQDKAIARN